MYTSLLFFVDLLDDCVFFPKGFLPLLQIEHKLNSYRLLSFVLQYMPLFIAVILHNNIILWKKKCIYKFICLFILFYSMFSHSCFCLWCILCSNLFFCLRFCLFCLVEFHVPNVLLIYDFPLSVLGEWF